MLGNTTSGGLTSSTEIFILRSCQGERRQRDQVHPGQKVPGRSELFSLKGSRCRQPMGFTMRSVRGQRSQPIEFLAASQALRLEAGSLLEILHQLHVLTHGVSYQVLRLGKAIADLPAVSLPTVPLVLCSCDRCSSPWVVVEHVDKAGATLRLGWQRRILGTLQTETCELRVHAAVSRSLQPLSPPSAI